MLSSIILYTYVILSYFLLFYNRVTSIHSPHYQFIRTFESTSMIEDYIEADNSQSAKLEIASCIPSKNITMFDNFVVAIEWFYSDE